MHDHIDKGEPINWSIHSLNFIVRKVISTVSAISLPSLVALNQLLQGRVLLGVANEPVLQQLPSVGALQEIEMAASLV